MNSKSKSGPSSDNAEKFPALSNEKLQYIEESGLMFETLGMTRMTGRVFGYLIICDLDAASFDQIREAVRASKGSISGTLKQLMQIDFVEAISYPGDRKTYYRPTKVSIGTLLNSRNYQTKMFSDSLQKARSLKSREDDVSDWLLEVSCFYEWIGKRLADLVEEWETIKVSHLKKKQNAEKNNHHINIYRNKLNNS